MAACFTWKYAALTFLQLGCAAWAAPWNSLYFGLDNRWGIAEDYWWFLADGRVFTKQK